MKRARLMEYEWMVKYTPQTEWIEGNGVMLLLAFFFTEFGAGIYLVSLSSTSRGGGCSAGSLRWCWGGLSTWDSLDTRCAPGEYWQNR